MKHAFQLLLQSLERVYPNKHFIPRSFTENQLIPAFKRVLVELYMVDETTMEKKLIAQHSKTYHMTTDEEKDAAYTEAYTDVITSVLNAIKDETI